MNRGRSSCVAEARLLAAVLIAAAFLYAAALAAARLALRLAGADRAAEPARTTR